MKVHRHHTGRVLMIIGIALVGIAMAGPVNADPVGAPPGNNGTIKIDGTDVDSHPDNEPHVGCVFQVDFYGYEAGVPVSMKFEVQPPTGDAVIHEESGTLDDDDATGGGSEAGLDGEFTIDLTDALGDYVPQPNQGYHVKLTITADDGNPEGAQLKHKVFWVTDCGGATTTTEATTTTSKATTTSRGVAPTTATTGPTTATTKATEVLGVELPRTGFSGTLLVIGTTLVAIGLAVEVIVQAAKRRGALS